MMTADAAERRSKISSLSSGRTPGYLSGTPTRVPRESTPEIHSADPDMEAAGTAAMERLLALEPLEKLESAGKYSRARWKIQIWIKSGRSNAKPLAFSLSFWESGKRLHGGGDESAFICRRNHGAPKPAKPPFLALGRTSFANEASPDGCGGIILGEACVGGFAVCPHCGVRWDTEHIADSIYYYLPVEVAATVISTWFRTLGSDCDLYLKYRDDDIRVKMMAQTYGLAEATRHKGLMIYSLARLVQDMSAGATLESRVKAVLLA